MNAELERAFAALEANGSGFEQPLELYTAEFWRAVDRRVPGCGPRWYRELTQRYCVGGAYFEYPLDPDRCIGACTILRPSWIPDNILNAYFAFPELFEEGFFCFADGDDGNLWMFRNDASDDPFVHFLDHTSWAGGALDRGLISPSLTLSQLVQFGAAWKPEGQ